MRKLGEEHESIRQAVRDFAESEIRPRAMAIDRDEKIPPEILRQMGTLGFLGIPYPEEVGGAGMDTLSYAIAVEEVTARLREHRDHDGGAHEPGNLPDLQVRDPCAEGTVSAQADHGRVDRRLRSDRTGRGLGRRGDPDDRRPRRRQLDSQRFEDLHHQRQDGAHPDHGRAHLEGSRHEGNLRFS